MILIPNDKLNEIKPENRRVLAIDDDTSLLEAYETILRPPQDSTSKLQAMAGIQPATEESPRLGFELTTATQGQQGFSLAKAAFEDNTPFALAFIDVRMPPGWNGLQTAIELRKLDPRMYIVMVTAYSDFSINEIHIGVQHNVLLIHKPFSEDEVYQLARNLCQSWNRDQELLDLRATQDRKINLQESQLYFQMSHDKLTGLFNRDELERRVGGAIHRAKLEKEIHYIFFINIDNFRLINESCGQFAGDHLIIQTAQLFRKKLRKQDSFARLGGDEFAVLLEYCSEKKAVEIAQDILEEVKDFRFEWLDKKYDLGVSIGIAAIDETTSDIADVIRFVGAACGQAKGLGGQRMYVYRPDDQNLEKHFSNMEWVSKLNAAIKENRILLYSQEIAPLSSDTVQGKHFEILLRLADENGEIVTPGVFLPIAEVYQLMQGVDRLVISNSFAWLARNPSLLEATSLCSINLSGQSLGDEAFLTFISQQLELHHLPPSKICFEVTETAAINNLQSGITFINKLRSMGFRFALDDFGSGLSSFAYLKNLPVDFVKIDGIFVKDIANDKINRELVKSINDIAHVMGKKTIAEFVENDEIMAILKAIGVDYAQGYGIAKPKPVEETDNAVQLPNHCDPAV